jgi:hypothetical protein
MASRLKKHYASIVIPKGTTTPFRLDALGYSLADGEKLIREEADRRFGENSWAFDVKPLPIGDPQPL